MKILKMKTTYVTIIAIALCIVLAITIAMPITASADTASVDEIDANIASGEYGIMPLALNYTNPLSITVQPLGSGRYRVNVFVDVKPSRGNLTYVDEICIYWKGYTVEANSAKYTNRWFSGIGGTGTEKNSIGQGTYSRSSESSYICFPLDLKSYFFNGLKRYDCDSSQLSASFIVYENGDTKSQGMRGSYLHKTGPGNFSALTINVSSDGERLSLSGASVGIFTVTDQTLTTI